MARQRRKQIKKADAILSADWHFRPDIPECRTDNYFAAMEKKINFILDLSEKHECPILIAGDLGQWPEKAWPTRLLEWVINKFSGHKIICIVGQHDLPGHKLSLWRESGIGVLHAAGAVQLIGVPELSSNMILEKFSIDAFSYGNPIHHISVVKNLEIPKVAMTHQTVLHGKSVFDGIQARELLQEYDEYDLILSGDNHLSFTEEFEERLLVNPGSLMRSNADQINHKPLVYLWYAEDNSIEGVYLPIEQNVISRSHIKDESKAERENKFDALIQRIRDDIELKLIFEKNIISYLKVNKEEQEIKDKVIAHVK